MIYSKWKPATGQYDYFETSEQHGIGDDLSTPRLAQFSPIGVASVDAGRRLPASARAVGSGPDAKGCVVPIARSALGTITNIVSKEALYFIGGLATMWLIFRYKK